MVNNTFAGEYHSAFKGQGLEFDEVRPYQPGDEIRTIDWNVTARTGNVFIKKFKEEREQTLFILFDISGSEDFGVEQENKRLVGTELAAVMAFSAMKNNDKIGLATFSDQIEHYYRPQRGRKHVLALIKHLLTTERQKSAYTDIGIALEFFRKTQKKRSILVLISDFLDQQYEHVLVRLAKRHEIILIRLFHEEEVLQQGFGTVPVLDIETQKVVWIHAGDTHYRTQLLARFSRIDEQLQFISKKHTIGYVSINTQKPYFPVVEKFFKKRNARRKI